MALHEHMATHHVHPPTSRNPSSLLHRLRPPAECRLLSNRGRAPPDGDRRADGSVAVRTLREEEALRRSEEGKARRKRNTLKMPGKQQQQHQQEEQDLQQLKQLIPGLGGGANVSQVGIALQKYKYQTLFTGLKQSWVQYFFETWHSQHYC